jgi:hypothetical protein
MADSRQIEAQILAWLDHLRPAMTELLERLVNIDSGSYGEGTSDVSARLTVLANRFANIKNIKIHFDNNLLNII